MAKPLSIQFPGEDPIPILYEDRSVLAIDKPAGWMLVPLSWQKTNRNLQAAIESSLVARHFWARSRNLKFLRYIHRLDAETSGILLFAKSPGALNTVGDREPRDKEWTCRLALTPDPGQIGRIVTRDDGKPAETLFRVLASGHGRHLIEARPYTGRQHQIRVHLAEAGCPVHGDELYGRATAEPMALRAVGLAYQDPFTRKNVFIRAAVKEFLSGHGFNPDAYRVIFESGRAGKPGEPGTGGGT
jgi:23S rRNA pseudouridine1911/1915/1917 synthase